MKLINQYWENNNLRFHIVLETTTLETHSRAQLLTNEDIGFINLIAQDVIHEIISRIKSHELGRSGR